MKLEMTLPERPGFMQVLPLFDILALLLMFLLLGPTFIVEQGIDVRLPQSEGRLTRFLNPIVVTLSGGADPAVYVEGARVEMSDLGESLDELLELGRWEEGDTVLIKADESLALVRYNQVVDIVRGRGLRCAQAVRPLISQ